MKRLGISAILAFAILWALPAAVSAERLLIPVGQIVGLQLRTDDITVAAYDDVLGAGARSAGLKIGDCIQAVNGQPIRAIEDIHPILESSPDAVRLTVSRGSRQVDIRMEPTDTASGPKLGVYLRQGITGLGTVTWYDPATGAFGALGHGVNDSSGCLLKVREGSAFPAQVMSVNRGRSGHPGQLKGSAEGSPCASLTRNTPQGIFGKNPGGWLGEAVGTAGWEQLHTGPASILSTVSNDAPKSYSVEILKLYPADRTNGRNLLLKVTDKALLETTGGIVQGMSGSPILQDGRLVGAVTHVLVNDPTMGYGIYIGNMLDAAA